MQKRFSLGHAWTLALVVSLSVMYGSRAAAADAPEARQAADAFVAALNAGHAAEAAALFVPQGELTDESGNVHQGRAAIEALLTRFGERYPGARLKQEVSSARLLGASLALLEGTHTIAARDGAQPAVNHFTAVLVENDGKWSFATCQHSADEREPSLHERLAPLAWMVGDWVDESADGRVAISCRWSDDKNFLLVTHDSKRPDRGSLKSEQRIGWDPLTERVRSWTFDSDGGYGEGHWTRVDASWIIKSTAVLPDGTTGSATIIVQPAGKDKFVMKGLDRVLGDGTQADFQVTIVRKAPAPAK